jgi:high-affinity iron transporter
VGIIAAFLGQQGRKDALRQVWIGTAAAVAICVGVAIALQVISSDLPQRQQEGLETVVGALAVCLVTYMIVFMRGTSAASSRTSRARPPRRWPPGRAGPWW